MRTLDIAKRLLDFGVHPPTTYFPLIVPEALMIEPTETESKETLDYFIAAMLQIADEAETEPGNRHNGAAHHRIQAPGRRRRQQRAESALGSRPGAAIGWRRGLAFSQVLVCTQPWCQPAASNRQAGLQLPRSARRSLSGL